MIYHKTLTVTDVERSLIKEYSSVFNNIEFNKKEEDAFLFSCEKNGCEYWLKVDQTVYDVFLNMYESGVSFRKKVIDLDNMPEFLIQSAQKFNYI